jgi:hypothetical protein
MSDIKREPGATPDDKDPTTIQLPDAAARLIKDAFSSALVGRSLDAGLAASDPSIDELELRSRERELAAQRILAREVLERLGLRMRTPFDEG